MGKKGKALVHGVFSLSPTVDAGAWIEGIRTLHGAPDGYEKSNTIEFFYTDTEGDVHEDFSTPGLSSGYITYCVREPA